LRSAATIFSLVGTPPDALLRLVDLSACNAQADRFGQDHKVFLSADYKEEQLRLEFLNPFFTSIVWDVSSKAGPRLVKQRGSHVNAEESGG
jgi:hypothetical protein